jgi:LacI family transcriptional regulator
MWGTLLAGILARPWARRVAAIALVALTIALFILNLRRQGERVGRAAERLDQLMQRAPRGQDNLAYGPSGVVQRASTQRLHVTDRLVIRALEHIRINAGLNIRVSDVADHLGVTRRWVEKRFDQTLQRSVLDEIQRVRMDTIRALVGETAAPFTQIAKRCGFTSANHLGIIFKSRFGMTMSDYRKTLSTTPDSQ